MTTELSAAWDTRFERDTAREAELLIAKGDRKRRIAMPFGVCGSRKAVEALRDACQRFLDEPGNGCGISYGWFRVEEPSEWVYGPANTQPETWDV